MLSARAIPLCHGAATLPTVLRKRLASVDPIGRADRAARASRTARAQESVEPSASVSRRARMTESTRYRSGRCRLLGLVDPACRMASSGGSICCSCARWPGRATGAVRRDLDAASPSRPASLTRPGRPRRHGGARRRTSHPPGRPGRTRRIAAGPSGWDSIVWVPRNRSPVQRWRRFSTRAHRAT